MSSNKQYFFIFGSTPSLSAAELQSVFKFSESSQISLGRDFLIGFLEGFVPSELIRKLGGTVKIGVIDGQLEPSLSVEKIAGFFNSKPPVGKYHFGFSYYPAIFAHQQKRNLFRLGLALKKKLAKEGWSLRMVVSKDDNLSSVVVAKNKMLTETGRELVFLETENKVYMGHTLAVQPFAEFSSRDYGRPQRDDKSGMLPPKLAQIMINLSGAKKKSILLDPFCGSGTVLQEALLLGVEQVMGFDLSELAVNSTITNLKWLRQHYQGIGRFTIRRLDVKKIDREVKHHSLDVIVTEPDLGSPRLNKKKVASEIRRLEILYQQAYRAFASLLRPGGKVVMVWPIFFNSRYLQLAASVSKLGFKRVEPYPIDWQKVYCLNERNNIEYGRPQQKVKREVTIWQKI